MVLTEPLKRTVNSLELIESGLKIYFTGPSDKMSDDVLFFGSHTCPMTFSTVLTRK